MTTSPRSTDAEGGAGERDGAPGGGTEPGSEPRAVPMRLQKFLARAGVASRRGSEDLMTAGRVAVNGTVTTELGAKVDPAVDRVTVDGREVSLGEAPAYYVLHKPAGYVTTMDDPQGRPTVRDLLPADAPAGLFPVGRLDLDTTGLLLLTTDGELGHRLLHPRYHVPKTYRVLADGRLTEADCDRLRAGIELDDGLTQPAEVRLERAGRTSEAVVTIREGRKRQVRRMFSAVGYPVLELERERFGPVLLGDLEPGETRRLTEAEVAALKAEAGLE